jgi:hypothetical protein
LWLSAMAKSPGHAETQTTKRNEEQGNNFDTTTYWDARNAVRIRQRCTTI